MEKNYKNNILKELKRLKKDIKELSPDLDSLELYLKKSTQFHRTLTRYDSKGEMTVYYGDFTLTFYIKSGNIIIGDVFELWNTSGTGFVGSFTERTLQMEGSGELD